MILHHTHCLWLALAFCRWLLSTAGSAAAGYLLPLPTSEGRRSALHFTSLIVDCLYLCIRDCPQRTSSRQQLLSVVNLLPSWTHCLHGPASFVDYLPSWTCFWGSASFVDLPRHDNSFRPSWIWGRMAGALLSIAGCGNHLYKVDIFPTDILSSTSPHPIILGRCSPQSLRLSFTETSSLLFRVYIATAIVSTALSGILPTVLSLC